MNEEYNPNSIVQIAISRWVDRKPKPKERRYLMAEWMDGRGIHSHGIESFVEEGKYGNIQAVENALLQEVLVQGGLRMFVDFVDEFDLHVQVLAKLNF